MKRRGKPVRRKAALSQQERSALSDRRFVQAAVHLLARAGVEGTTIQAVAARAGYNHALIVHRYGGKAGLLLRVMEHVDAHWQKLVAERTLDRRGLEGVHGLIDAYIVFAQDEADELTAMYRLWFHSVDPSSTYRSHLSKVHALQRDHIARWLEEGIADGTIHYGGDVRVFAERLGALLSGFMYQWMTDRTLPIVDMYRDLQRDLERALAARSDQSPNR